MKALSSGDKGYSGPGHMRNCKTLSRTWNEFCKYAHHPGSNTLPFDKWMEIYGYTYKEMFKEDVMCGHSKQVQRNVFDIVLMNLKQYTLIVKNLGRF